MATNQKSIFRWCWITLLIAASIAILVVGLFQIKRIATNTVDDLISTIVPNDMGPQIREPLVLAASENNAEEVKHLLLKGHDVNSQSRSGFTAIGIATRYGYKDVVEILLEHNADLSIPDRFGSYPLGTAVEFADNEEENEIIRLLVLAGGDPDKKCPNAIQTPRQNASLYPDDGRLEAIIQGEEDRTSNN